MCITVFFSPKCPFYQVIRSNQPEMTKKMTNLFSDSIVEVFSDVMNGDGMLSSLPSRHSKRFCNFVSFTYIQLWWRKLPREKNDKAANRVYGILRMQTSTRLTGMFFCLPPSETLTRHKWVCVNAHLHRVNSFFAKYESADLPTLKTILWSIN